MLNTIWFVGDVKPKVPADVAVASPPVICNVVALVTDASVLAGMPTPETTILVGNKLVAVQASVGLPLVTLHVCVTVVSYHAELNVSTAPVTVAVALVLSVRFVELAIVAVAPAGITPLTSGSVTYKSYGRELVALHVMIAEPEVMLHVAAVEPVTPVAVVLAYPPSSSTPRSI